MPPPGLALSCLCGAGPPDPEQPRLGTLGVQAGIRGGCSARAGDNGDELGRSIPRHRAHTAWLGQGITVQTWVSTMLGHWVLPVHPAWGNATHLPRPSPARGGIFHSRMEVGGRRVFAAAPSSPSPRPSPEQLGKAPATFVSGKVQSKSLPGVRDPWRGPATPGSLRGSLHSTFQRSHPACSHAAAPCLLPGWGSPGSGSGR